MFYPCVHSGYPTYIFIASLLLYIPPQPLWADPSTPPCVLPLTLVEFTQPLKPWPSLFGVVCLFLELLILIVSSLWVKPGPLPLSVFNSSLTFSTQSGVKEWVNLSEAKGPSLCPDVDFWHDHCHVEARAAVSTHNRHSDDHCIYSPAQRQGRAIFVEPSQGWQHAASVSKKSWRHILQHLFLPRSPNRK